jgi:hypothetical protein
MAMLDASLVWAVKRPAMKTHRASEANAPLKTASSSAMNASLLKRGRAGGGE